MKLTISFPNSVAKRVCRLKDPDEFVSRAVERALDQGEQVVESPDAEAKWARLVQRIESEATGLGDYYGTFKKDLAEVRETRFKDYPLPWRRAAPAP